MQNGSTDPSVTVDLAIYVNEAAKRAPSYAKMSVGIRQVLTMLCTLSKAIDMDETTEFAVLLSALIGWHMANGKSRADFVAQVTDLASMAPNGLKDLYLAVREEVGNVKVQEI